ncbi:MAG TPA: hypothetical protein VFF69_01830, partial [Phycisphaerales bacterium]|nr:hypothetical protein [Phycisphaerales bacterium]
DIRRADALRQIETDPEVLRHIRFAIAQQIDLRGWQIRRAAAPWLAESWRDLIATGSASRSRRAPTVQLILYFGSALAAGMATAGAALSVLFWFMRACQISAYRRMLMIHDLGRCPDCGYDISAAPSQPCPECGCDHRARRREALAALRGAPGTAIMRGRGGAP